MPRRRIQVRTKLADGSSLWGWLDDMSQQGMRVAGDTGGLTVGDEVDVVLIYPSTMKITYRCSVRHLDHERRFWGVEMISAPAMVCAELKV